MGKKKYALREKKHAQTKLAIMRAFIERLKNTRYDNISIREVCENVEVSEGTFFNYFPEKIDIINYYMHLVVLKTAWKSKKVKSRGRYLDLIDKSFETLAEEFTNPNLIYEMISIMVIQKDRPKKITIPDIEKCYAFPECEGIEAMPTLFIDDFYRGCLKNALKNGELPPKTNLDDVLISLEAILGGTMMAVKLEKSSNLSYHMKRQLSLLWKGLGRKT